MKPIGIAASQASRLEGGRRMRGAHKNSSAERPLVSIVTAVYNGEKQLQRAIDSVLSQTYSPVEYIVVDGGSSDGTKDILRCYDEHIDYWISEPDAGISDAFNKGIRASRGLLLGILAADDWYERDTVERVVSVYLQNPVDIVHGVLRYWENDKVTSVVEADDTQLFHEMTLNHPTMFATRQCYEAVGPYAADFKYAMDYEWVVRAKVLGKRFAYIPGILANMSRGGISDARWRAALREVALAKATHLPGGRLHYIDYWYQLLKGSTRDALHAMGLSRLVAQYHARLSRVRKIDEPR